ncbi:MAG: class I SAM-dependent methyltransferase [Candidatus Hydrogenedentes bacterium]|nr:class I SAM-dependent methyltransferase [Candidatus Hydrogenedentota bacterium]
MMWHIGARLGVAPVLRYLRRAKQAGLRSLVDVGAGGGSNSLLAAQEGFAVVSCDLVPACLRETTGVAKRIGVDRHLFSVCSDALVLPFSDGSFDVAFASHIIEHLDDPRGLLCELNRILRPGGRLRVACPTPYHGMRVSVRLGYCLDPPDHKVLGYSVSDVESMLPAGMTIERVTYQGRFLEANLADLQHVVSRWLGLRANPIEPARVDGAGPGEIGLLVGIAKEVLLVPAVALCTLEDALLSFTRGSMMSLEIVKANE